MVDCNKRLVEVDEILNYLSKDDLLKIPDEVRNTIKENKDKEYFWQYDETKPLKDQDVSRDTIAFLSYLNMEYLLNEEQKQVMQQIHEFNEKRLEEEKSNQYNFNDLFKNKTINNDTVQEQSVIEYKRDNFLRKVINKIKSFLQNI